MKSAKRGGEVVHLFVEMRVVKVKVSERRREVVHWLIEEAV